MTDYTIHIHEKSGDVCVACGDADDGTHSFTTDPGAWSRTKDRCDPSVIVDDVYDVINRDDLRTSALLDERKPPTRKDPQSRSR